MEQSYGIVNIQDLGNIIVPGRSDESRIAYAQSLFYKVGVFIPVSVPTCNVIAFEKYTDPDYLKYNADFVPPQRIALHRRKVDDPIIALGTLNDYICFDALTLAESILFHPNFYLLDGHIEDLLAFNSYLIPVFNSKFLREEEDPDFLEYGTIHSTSPDLWIWIVSGISKWINMERAIRDLPSNTVERILQLLTTIYIRADDICVNDPEKMGDDITYRDALVKLMQIIPNLILAEPDYATVNDVYSNEIPIWCDAAYSFGLLLKKIRLVYNTFGGRVTQRGLTLTGSQKGELLETQPAILYQPGGYAVGLYQQQGPWRNK